MDRNTLATYLQTLLQPTRFRDAAPNGLQVEGKSKILRIMTGVTACQALLDAAVAEKVDAVLVHHGLFWKGASPIVTGMMARRIKTLLLNDINLFAYHLPLDVHPEYGNNTQWGRHMGFQWERSLDGGDGCPNLIQVGACAPIAGEALAAKLAQTLGRVPFYVPGDTSMIQSVAWCSGAAQSYLSLVADQGVDAYITGEVLEHTVHEAKERGIHFFAAGHHATERYGVRALGAHLAQHFGITHIFHDVDSFV